MIDKADKGLYKVSQKQWEMKPECSGKCIQVFMLNYVLFVKVHPQMNITAHLDARLLFQISNDHL